MVVHEGNVSRRDPRADHQGDQREGRDLEVIRRQDQDHSANYVELRVVGYVPTPQHALFKKKKNASFKSAVYKREL